MGIREVIALVRKRWTIILALTALGLAVALGATLTATPMYTASTQIYVAVQGSASTNDLLQGSNFTRQQVASYTRLVSSPLVLGPVIDELGLDTRAESLGSQVRSDSPPNSSLINITVTDSSPAMAAALAGAIAQEFRTVVADLEVQAEGGLSTVKLTVVRDASAPTAPSSPNEKLNLFLGLLGGLGAGVLLALVRETLDTRIRDERTVAELTDKPIIGVIMHDDEAEARPLIVQADPKSPRAEAFRRLRTNIQFLDVPGTPSVFAVTSSLPGEGKSTTTINLAVALADAGTRVLLIDADLRRPSVGKYLGLEQAAGLTTVLIGRATMSEVVQPWGNGMLTVLPAGRIPPNPSELLGSRAMGELLSAAASRYDVVLIDTPPLLPVTDAAVLSKLVAGVLVVVGAGKLDRRHLSESLGALATVNARVLGLVINRDRRTQRDTYQYYEEEHAGRARKNAKRRGVVARPGSRRTSEAARIPLPAASITDDGSQKMQWPGTLENVSASHSATPPQHQRSR